MKTRQNTIFRHLCQLSLAPVFIMITGLKAEPTPVNTAIAPVYAAETCPAYYTEPPETALQPYNATVLPPEVNSCKPLPVSGIPEYTFEELIRLSDYFRYCQPGFEHNSFPDPQNIEKAVSQCLHASETLALIKRYQRETFDISHMKMLAGTLSEEPLLRRSKNVQRTVKPTTYAALKSLHQAGITLNQYGLIITVPSHNNVALDSIDFLYSTHPGDTIVLDIPASDDTSLILDKEMQQTRGISHIHTWHVLTLFSNSFNTRTKEIEFVRVMRLMALLAPYSDDDINLKLLPLWANRVRDVLFLDRMHALFLPDVLSHSDTQIINLAQLHGYITTLGLKEVRKRLQKMIGKNSNPMNTKDFY